MNVSLEALARTLASKAEGESLRVSRKYESLDCGVCEEGIGIDEGEGAIRTFSKAHGACGNYVELSAQYDGEE